jgi:hypothetical protein
VTVVCGRSCGPLHSLSQHTKILHLSSPAQVCEGARCTGSASLIPTQRTPRDAGLTPPRDVFTSTVHYLTYVVGRHAFRRSSRTKGEVDESFRVKHEDRNPSLPPIRGHIQEQRERNPNVSSRGLPHGRVYNTSYCVTESDREGRVKLCMGWDVSGVWDGRAWGRDYWGIG